MSRTRRAWLMLVFALPVAVSATDLTSRLQAHARAQFAVWAQAPVVVEAVKAQNARHAGLSQAQVAELDHQWHAELRAGGGPLIDATLNNPLSAYLRRVQADANGLYSEIFVMDAKGLNVGQSDVTSDYWQGDEAKWQQTYLAGPRAIHVGPVEQDESTQVFQAQVSVPIIDHGTPIGTLTVGVNVGGL